jgi:sugar/nucleoside kinase (ribokinase family)
MSDFELLSVGDATLDMFMKPTESESLCQLDDKDCLICFTYGDKIPVKNVEFCVGGNAANNVVGTRRLGVKSGIVLTLGDDMIGNLIVEKLKAEEADLTYVIQQPSTNSNFSTIIDYGGERTIFTYHAPRSYEFPVQLPVVPWLYLTSMGESFRPFYKHVIEWLGKNPTVKLAFNPGSWQLKSGLKDGIAEILARAEVVFVNREEAEGLTGFGQSQGKEKELLQALNKLGPKVCVITDGGKGSFVMDARNQGQRFLRAGVLPVDAYQRTGAGDAFGSGCLSAIIKGKDLGEALIWGTVNSASVIGYTGAQKGLLKMDELPEWLERVKSSGVEVGEF